MRTNIVLNDDLVTEAMRYSRARTKRALVEEALRVLIDTRSSSERLATYRDRVEAIRQRTADIKLGGSAYDIVRADRDTHL